MRRILILFSFLAAILFAPPAACQTAVVRKDIKKLEINNQTHLAIRRYLPENPKGSIYCLHGIQSHSGWYLRSAQMLAENGYNVYAQDRRGSGLNGQDRGHLQNYTDLIADMDATIGYIRGENPGLPVYIMGVSWGGKQALLYECMRPGQVDGLILSAPGIKAKRDLSPANKVKVFWYAKHSREEQPEIPIPLEKSSLFTNDPKWQNWIEQDPLTLHSCTARFFWESHRMDKQLQRLASESQAPILLMLAENDDITDNEKLLKFVGNKLPQAENGQIKIIEYPGARHTLEFEPYWRKVVQDILKWLGQTGKTQG